MKITLKRLGELCLVATKENRPDLSKWLLDRASEKSCRKCVPTAAQWGDLDILQWLRSKNCSWSDACLAAADGGHLHVLQWLRAQEPPCPWGKKVCQTAAKRGHYEVLKWLRAQEPACPWERKVCCIVAKKGNLTMLQWLRAQEPPCPWDETIFETSSCKDVIGWALLHGCPAPARLEKLRTQLIFMACIKHLRPGVIRVTRSHSFADRFLKLPTDVIRHIASFLGDEFT